MVKVFYDSDAELNDLQGETVALIGYGIQGRAQALNMRDSGLNIIIGNRDDEFRRRAVEDGFPTYDIAEAAQHGTIILMLIPDEVQPDVYRSIEQYLTPGKALVFAHGFAIRYNLINPPDTIDTLLVSPRMPGGYTRDFFLRGDGVPAFVDVKTDATGKAWQRALALAKAVGLTRPGVMQISFAEETELDHFAEHFIYPLIFAAIELSYDVLVKNGYTPEAAIMELYGSREVGEVMVTAAKVGMYNMLDRNASPACQFGVYTYMPQLFGAAQRAQVQGIIDTIKAGTFAQALVNDQKAGHPQLKQMVADAHQSQVTQMEARVREIMKFKWE